LEVSGDYYDYFLRRDGRIAVVIADVSGKGVPASLLMANLQAAVQLKLADETDLAATVDDLNALISRNLSESRFITAMFGLLDPAARKLTYVNAGHLPPYLIQENASADAVKVPSGFPIGVVENARYEARELVFPDTPSTLLLYTDGVTEAMNEQGELFTDERLAALLRANLSQPPRELVTRVRRSIKQFTRSHPQTDDITLVALRLA
jgi:sigma-B regulation protein RsbU (phosphoserine phosphatase)